MCSSGHPVGVRSKGLSVAWVVPVCAAVAFTMQADARASTACAYFATRNVLTAIELPDIRFRYRVAVPLERGLTIRNFVVAAQAHQAFLGVSESFNCCVLGQADQDRAFARGEVAPPRQEALVVDLLHGRVSKRLDFNPEAWAYSPVRNLVAAATGGTVVLYDVASGQVRSFVALRTEGATVLFSDDGKTLYATHYAWGFFPGLFPTALSVTDLDTRQELAFIRLPGDRDPFTFIKPPGLNRGYFGPSAFDGPGAERGLLVMDLEALTILKRVELPEGFSAPGAAAASPDGRRIYIPTAGHDSSMELRVLAVPEDEFLPGIGASVSLVSRVVVDPELRWVAAVSLTERAGTQQLTVWDPDLSEQRQIAVFGFLGDGPELVQGPCPDVNPCISDCDGDGTVSVDEVVKAVRVALGALDIRDCLAADSSGNGEVSVEELVQAVNDLLSGCDGAGTGLLP